MATNFFSTTFIEQRPLSGEQKIFFTTKEPADFGKLPKKFFLFKIPAENIFYLDFEAVQDRDGNFKFYFGALLVRQSF